MAELELCVFCKMPIKPEEDWVEVERAVPEPKDFGKPEYVKHAHVKCYEEMAAIARDL